MSMKNFTIHPRISDTVAWLNDRAVIYYITEHVVAASASLVWFTTSLACDHVLYDSLSVKNGLNSSQHNINCIETPSACSSQTLGCCLAEISYYMQVDV